MQLQQRKSGLWTPAPSEVWMPPTDALYAIQEEKRSRLERDYRFVYNQLTGRSPRGDWLDRLTWEITRWAAPALVNKGTQTFGDNSTSLSLSYTGATAGGFLVATVAASRFSTTQAAINLPAGWTQAERPTSVGNASGFGVAPLVCYKENIASGTHTASITGLPATSFSAGIISEFSGIATASSLDQHTNNGSATTATSGNTGTTPSTTQASELVIATGHAEDGIGNTAAFTNPSSGYTNLAVTATNSVHIAWSAGYKLLAATGTQIGSFTWTTNSIWTAAIATFLGAGGGGGSSTLIGYYFRMLAGLC